MNVSYTNAPWTTMEEEIIRQYWTKEPFESIQNMMPRREPAAIERKARALGFSNGKPKPTTRTIDQLEAELNLKKAELEVQSALDSYALFRNQCRADWVRIMKANSSVSLEDQFKLNAKTFSKHITHISNGYRKLLKMQVENDLS